MDLGYINARIRAWKGMLLKREDYNRLIYSEGIEPLLELMKKGVYARALELARARFGEEDRVKLVDHGLKEDLLSTLRLLLEGMPEKGRSLMAPLYSHWEVYNIKTILRGMERGLKAEEIYWRLFPVGGLDEFALKELSYQKGIEEVIHLLFMWGSPYARPLRRAYGDYRKRRSLFILELELDRSLYHLLLEGIPSGNEDVAIARAYIQSRIDATNLLSLFKIAMEGPSSLIPSDLFVEGGRRVRRKDFESLFLSKDIEDLLHRLRGRLHDYRWLMVIERLFLEDPSLLEEGFEGLIMGDMGRMGRVKPLTIAVAYHFAMAKWREVKTLSFIARAKAFDIPPHEVERYVKWTGYWS